MFLHQFVNRYGCGPYSVFIQTVIVLDTDYVLVIIVLPYYYSIHKALIITRDYAAQNEHHCSELDSIRDRIWN